MTDMSNREVFQALVNAGMSVEAFQQARFLAVYGAAVALAVQRYRDEHSTMPDGSAMRSIIDDAHLVANAAGLAIGDPER